jgi:hypothetical protein
MLLDEDLTNLTPKSGNDPNYLKLPNMDQKNMLSMKYSKNYNFSNIMEKVIEESEA